MQVGKKVIQSEKMTPDGNLNTQEETKRKKWLIKKAIIINCIKYTCCSFFPQLLSNI